MIYCFAISLTINGNRALNWYGNLNMIWPWDVDVDGNWAVDRYLSTNSSVMYLVDETTDRYLLNIRAMELGRAHELAQALADRLARDD